MPLKPEARYNLYDKILKDFKKRINDKRKVILVIDGKQGNGMSAGALRLAEQFDRNEAKKK